MDLSHNRYKNESSELTVLYSFFLFTFKGLKLALGSNFSRNLGMKHADSLTQEKFPVT